ncbi:ferritin light chain-like [Oryx dammah]|uniref:ferritin light chain-like n=1 Tax=Oryx dammah TaxID=59534 RepID=UPI001A9B813D|nr:ferritin light chain-like [Oryx dammah]
MEAVNYHHASVGLLNLPLSGFYFHLHDVAPEGVCRLFLAICRGELRGQPAPLENAKALWQQPPSSRTGSSRPKTEGGFLQEQVKRIRTMYDHVTNPRRMTGPQLRLGEHLIERLTLKLD